MMVSTSKEAAGENGVAAGASSTARTDHTGISAEHLAGVDLFLHPVSRRGSRRGFQVRQQKHCGRDRSTTGTRLGKNRLGMGSC